MKFRDVTGRSTDMQKAVAMTTLKDNGNAVFSHSKGLYGCKGGIVKDGNFRNRASYARIRSAEGSVIRDQSEVDGQR
jgi:hypothetical protein